MAEDSMEQEVQTEVIPSNEVDDASEGTIVADNSGSSEENNSTSDESNDDEISLEDLDAMDDDQFNAYVETGKKPTVRSKAEKKVESGDSTDKTSEAVSEQVDTQDSKQTQPDIDYKSVCDSIFRPFKANGKEITPRSVEDVISLMQMGANYTKKMQAMAPMKKAMASLNNAKISQEDLNFLIDVHKGDKEAIKKLLQQHKVDPMDLDLESTNYVPRNNIASDEDVDFNDVVQDLGDSLETVENIVNKRWDAESRKILLHNPDLLRKLGEEVQLGRFDAVQQVLDEERTFGRYKGVSDLEAYTDIVTKYVNYINQQQANRPKQQTQATRSVQSRPTNVSNKVKAAPTRANNVSRGKANFTANDIFSMSEEDFNKLSINDLI